MMVLGFVVFSAPVASAETRTLKLYFVHTREKAEITFKRNGRYDQAGLTKVNRFLRDWRRNEPTKMDPRLLDVVWEAYKQSGSRDYIHVVSAYRSPATNSMLRSRSKGVAKKSQHMLGKAMDFYLPDVKLKNLRNIGLKLQAGGVGYYPRSGSPFVHMDVGNVRHWPKMSRSELASVFPNGKTLHVPSDGKPLPGYEQAVASYQQRKKDGDLAIASAKSSGGGGKGRTLLAALFGGGADEEEDNSESAGEGGEVVVARAEPKAETPRAGSKIKVIDPKDAQRVELALAPEEEALPMPVMAALPDRDIPLPGRAPRPLIDVGAAQEPLVPFGTGPSVAEPMAGAEPVEAAPAQAEIALGIPVPTSRPAFTPPAELESATALAMASTDDPAMPLPSDRPTGGTANDALSVMAAASVAEEDPEAEADEVLVAALPQQNDGSAEDAFEASPDEIIAGNAGSTQLAAAGGAATKPMAGQSAKPKSAAAARTTAKSARATARDSKPQARAIVVAAQPAEARWALHTETVVASSRPTKAPTFSYDAAVAAIPREVLTAGFEPNGPTRDASRFSGKAVNFQGMAKFQN